MTDGARQGRSGVRTAEFCIAPKSAIYQEECKMTDELNSWDFTRAALNAIAEWPGDKDPAACEAARTAYENIGRRLAGHSPFLNAVSEALLARPERFTDFTDRYARIICFSFKCHALGQACKVPPGAQELAEMRRSGDVFFQALVGAVDRRTQ